MASKKGVSSTRNGRDSNAQRLGVKRYAGQVVTLVKSSCVSVEPTSTPAQTLAKAKTTLCSHLLPALLPLVPRVAVALSTS